jgi:hypothetical protein
MQRQLDYSSHEEFCFDGRVAPLTYLRRRPLMSDIADHWINGREDCARAGAAPELRASLESPSDEMLPW